MPALPPHLVRWLGFTYLRGRKMSPLHLALLAASDWLLLLALGRERPAPVPPLEGKRIVVAKIDHLGDVLMATPFLREMRTQAPSCRIDLLLGSWSRPLGELFQDEKLCDEIFYYDAPTLNKGCTSFLEKLARGWATFLGARRWLRRADIFIDLRTFSPNAILLARLAGVPHKIGFGLRGRAFFLQQELPYSPDRALGDLFLGALPALGLRDASYQRPYLPKPKTPRTQARDVSLPARFVAVHPFSLDQARMTRDDLWCDLIRRLAESTPVVVLGSADDGKSALATRLVEMTPVIPLMGRTTFRDAIEIVAGAGGFVGIDSVFSHVALAFDLPTLILLTRGAGNATSYPSAHSRLAFLDPDEPGANAETLAAAFFRIID